MGVCKAAVVCAWLWWKRRDGSLYQPLDGKQTETASVGWTQVPCFVNINVKDIFLSALTWMKFLWQVNCLRITQYTSIFLICTIKSPWAIWARARTPPSLHSRRTLVSRVRDLSVRIASVAYTHHLGQELPVCRIAYYYRIQCSFSVLCTSPYILAIWRHYLCIPDSQWF